MKVLENTSSLATHLECSSCKQHYPFDELQTFSDCCTRPLVMKYDLDEGFDPAELLFRDKSMWRYFEVLPLQSADNIVTLGEGMTPILPLENLAKSYGFSQLYMKEEGLNPTGSFKSRGISMAVSRARELGVDSCVVPTAGNAGGALSAYCARANMKATVIMPSHTPKIFQDECKLFGAELILVNGLINDCARIAKEIVQKTGAFDISTLKEPYRLEGKKTMGYEIAEHFGWTLPDVIIYPTGGGTGLIGIWKAFKEMQQMGWIRGKLPRMIAVQSANCSPLVQAFHNLPPEPIKSSVANGLAVPVAFAKDLIMETLHESGGTAMAVSEEKLEQGMREIGRREGINCAPEGGAVWEALKVLADKGEIHRDEKILLLNTGSGYKYFENFSF
jgi:threonine synthase